MAENEVNEAEANQQDQAESTGDESAAPAQDQQQTPEQQVPLAALQSEREKRQNAEQRLQTLERAVQQGQMQQPQQAPQQPELTNDQFFDNPLGYMAAFQQQTENKLRNEFSEQTMRREVGDAEYESKLTHFAGMVQRNPSLSGQLGATKDPARFAYQQAKADMQGIDLSDPDSLYKKALADAEAKLRAEFEQKMQASQGQTAQQDLPGSLATAPAAGGASSSDVLPNTDLKSLYNGR